MDNADFTIKIISQLTAYNKKTDAGSGNWHTSLRSLFFSSAAQAPFFSFRWRLPTPAGLLFSFPRNPRLRYRPLFLPVYTQIRGTGAGNHALFPPS